MRFRLPADSSGECHTPFVGSNRTDEQREEGTPVERDKALEMAMGQIEKQFGKGAVMRMGENSAWGSRPFRRAPSPLTLPSASAACRAAASWRSSDLNHRGSPPWPC